MADRTFDVSVVLGLVDKMSSGLKAIDNSLSGTTKALGSLAVAGVSIYTVTNYLTSAVKAAAQEEAAMSRLQFTVEKSGKSWITAEKQITDYLKATQKNSKYSGDELIPGIQKLVTFTGGLEKALKLTTLATDLASYKHIDLATAMTAVTQASQGNLRMLGMLIPGMRGLDKETLGLANNSDLADYALRSLQKTVGGFAEKELTQTEAKMEQAGVKTANLAQAIGGKLQPATRLIVMAFSEFIDFMRRVVDSTYLVEIGMGLLVAAIVGVGAAFALALPQVYLTAAAWTALAVATTTALTALSDYITKYKTQEDVYKKQGELIDAQIAKNQEEIDSLINKQIELGKDSGQYEDYQKEINRLTNENILLRKSYRADEKQDIIDKTSEATSAAILNWTEYYGTLTAMQIAAGQSGLTYMDTLRAETQKAQQQMIDDAAGGALQYDRISGLVMGSIFKNKEDRETIAKRKYEEGIIEMTTAWEKYYYQMDGYSRSWLNEFIEDNSKYISYVEFAASTITDLMSKNYQLRSIEAKNYADDRLAETDAQYNANKNRIETEVADEASRALQLAELDRNYLNDKAKIAAEQKAAQRKAYEEQKNWSINAAIIDGAVAITKTFAAYGFTPLGFVSAAAQAASTYAQIQIINATRYATGGMGVMGGIALVGEQGPELVSLPSGADVYNASNTRSMLASAGAGGPSVIIQVSGNYILNDRNAEGLADVISNIIVNRVKKERLI